MTKQLELKQVRLSATTFSVILALACLSPAHAAPPAAEGRPIKVIVFEPSPQPFTIDELDRFTGIKAGQTLRMAQIRIAIQNLFSSGRYANITVDSE